MKYDNWITPQKENRNARLPERKCSNPPRIQVSETGVDVSNFVAKDELHIMRGLNDGRF